MPRHTIVSLPGLSVGVACFVAAGLMFAACAVAQPDAAPPGTQPAGASPNAIRGAGAAMRLNSENMINMIRAHMAELKLSDEQKAKIDAVFDKAITDAKALEADATLQVQEKFPKIMQRIAQLKDEIKNVLDEKQKELFDKTVPFGRGGAGGGGGQGMAKQLRDSLAKLDLTPEQSEKIAKATEEFNAKIKDVASQIGAAGAGGITDDVRQKIIALGAEYREKLLGILTDDQRAKLHELMSQHPGGPATPPPSTATRAPDGDGGEGAGPRPPKQDAVEDAGGRPPGPGNP